MSALSGIKPQNVFKYFEEICNIPHGSGNTKQISDYLVEFAKGHSLKYHQDELNNIIIWKDATKGYENAPGVIIQGHMDMVCEKENDCRIDFEKDGLELVVDGNVIYAKGTTLGGDDGIAVAYALAILDSDEICHPSLEVVITVDEEIGMLGAAAIDGDLIKGRIMLNIDSEEEGSLLISCAGGTAVTCDLPVNCDIIQPSNICIDLKISGISGGHSGMEIINQGANANKVMGRVLYNLKKQVSYKLVSIQGGQKDNAIPRECNIVLTMANNETNIALLSDIVSYYNSILKNEYRNTDADINLSYEICNMNEDFSMTDESTDRVITALVNIPNGVMRMSSDISGLVQTSLNLGKVKSYNGLSNKVVRFVSLVRSSVESEKKEIVLRLECLLNSLGGSIQCDGDYPAWEYKKDSKLRELMINIYEKMYGKKPKVEAIHAGVECGLFAGKLNGLDCVSYGPRIEDIHTTSERIYIDSVVRTWNYTLEVLKQMRS